VGSRFESADWHEAVAEIILADDPVVLGAAMSRAIGVVIEHEGTCLLAFHNDASPEVLHHTLEPAGEKHYLQRYLDGPYLLDPLYQLAIRDTKPEFCRFRDELPDRFRASEYYRQYCERTHLQDEMDFLLEVSPRTTLVMVVGRRTKMFTRAEWRRLELLAPTVRAAMRQVWTLRASGHGQDQDGDFHRRLTDSFEHFGEGVLTDRERQISQLLLRGHSSKSIARELSIAPGTVMVHKRNLFAKLGISSQYELFSLLIDELGRQ
jgi:DNA-binding CsgD family transcriptional regulator